MNPQEIFEIKRTWDIPMQNPTNSGVAILVRFLTKYPSNQLKFPHFKDIPLDHLPDSARFRAHASRIIKVFDDSIQSLGHDWCGPKLEDIWTKIAVSHFNKEISKQSFNELKEVVLEVLSAACNLNEKQTACWIKLMDYVYEIVFRKLDELDKTA